MSSLFFTIFVWVYLNLIVKSQKSKVKAQVVRRLSETVVKQVLSSILVAETSIFSY